MEACLLTAERVRVAGASGGRPLAKRAAFVSGCVSSATARMIARHAATIVEVLNIFCEFGRTRCDKGECFAECCAEERRKRGARKASKMRKGLRECGSPKEASRALWMQ